MAWPMPTARASQPARIAANPAPRSHWRRRVAMARPQGRQQRGGVDRCSLFGKIRRGKFDRGGMMPAIYADADGDGHRIALPLDQDAGDLGAAAQHVVRPFEREAGGEAGRERGRGVMDGKRRRRRRVAAPRPPAPDRSAAGSHGGCPAATSRNGRAGRAPRSAGWPRSTSGPRSPARARRSASALVESTLSRKTTGVSPRQPGLAGHSRTAISRQRRRRRPAGPDRRRTAARRGRSRRARCPIRRPSGRTPPRARRNT